jgi:putative aminopeptidase FrvX
MSKVPVKLLEKLSNAIGLSGDEDEIRQIVIEEIKGHVDEYKVDALGNLLAVKHGNKKNTPRLMFAAHMDEVGFMLVEDEGDGIFAFEPVGGIDQRQLLAKPLLIGKNHIRGVIGSKPIHLASAEERKNAPSMSKLRIDVGPANAGKVKVGDYATFATRFQRAGDSFFGKALDDRLGVATLIELAKSNPAELEVLFAFTVQEEIGLRGASVAAYDFEPDMAFIIDSTPAFDLPLPDDETENVEYNCRLGAGPAIYLADRGTISDPRLIRFLVQLAETNHIPCQFRQPGGGGTDAGSIHVNRTGVPSVSISIPGRYAHSPILHAKLQDWQSTLDLLQLVLTHADRSILDVDRP